MYFETENVIDSKMKENAKLKVLKQKLEDKKNERNSRLETRCSALDTKSKALKDKAFRNDEVFKNKIDEIDRIIEKNEKIMKLESDHYKKLLTPTSKQKKRR